jgi:hypothetical protein
MAKAMTLTLAALAVLLGAGTAEAKELSSFRACGAAGCRETRNPALLRQLIHAVELRGKPVSTRTPSPAPFLRLDFIAKSDDGTSAKWSQYYTPFVDRLAIETDPDAWTWVKTGRLQRLLDRVTAGERPLSAPRITRVEIAGKVARDPESYTKLFRPSCPTDDYPDNPDWKTIRLVTARPSPWSTHAATLEYSPSTDVLWRGSEFIKVPAALASRLEARKSLAGVTTANSFPWAAFLGGIGAAAVVVPAALFVRRRRTP